VYGCWFALQKHFRSLSKQHGTLPIAGSSRDRERASASLQNSSVEAVLMSLFKVQKDNAMFNDATSRSQPHLDSSNKCSDETNETLGDSSDCRDEHGIVPVPLRSDLQMAFNMANSTIENEDVVGQDEAAIGVSGNVLVENAQRARRTSILEIPSFHSLKHSNNNKLITFCNSSDSCDELNLQTASHMGARKCGNTAEDVINLEDESIGECGDVSFDKVWRHKTSSSKNPECRFSSVFPQRGGGCV